MIENDSLLSVMWILLEELGDAARSSIGIFIVGIYSSKDGAEEAVRGRKDVLKVEYPHAYYFKHQIIELNPQESPVEISPWFPQGGY